MYKISEYIGVNKNQVNAVYSGELSTFLFIARCMRVQYIKYKKLSYTAEGPRDVLCLLTACQLLHHYVKAHLKRLT